MKLRTILLALIGLPALFSVNVQAQAETPEARVIVKLKAGSALKQIQAGSRIQSLGARLGLSAQMIGQPGQDVHVMHASGLTSDALAARLSKESDVEYAVPDRIKKISALPNDPLLAFQWYLQTPDVTRLSAIDAVRAWDMSSGSNKVVVAVVDTGVRFDHEDLAPRLLAGYDFVSDNLNAGDAQTGRDADASDPGDYASASDLANATLRNMCGSAVAHASSWHGTQVAGIVAAESNNSRGIAGVGGSTRILPVRVLGKCGGFDSDIIAGMRWAAGLAVPGVPANPNPAQIINLSLAGSGTCSAAYTSAIAEIRAAGALVVAAAGNETGAVEEPANCTGVLAVAGIRHAGTKVGISSYGREVGISAPAGNCVNIITGLPCLFPFINTTNLGATVPAGNGYTGTSDQTIGTSFAAPLAAGTAALMLAANPALSEAGLARYMKQGALPFPFDASLPTCPVVTSDGQCNCTTSTCGAGMLNAAGAVSAALAAAAASPVAGITVPASVEAGKAATFSASASTAAAGATLTGWKWTQTSGPATGTFGSGSAASTTFTAPSAGSYTIRLTVTDDAGRTGTTDASIEVKAAAKSSGGGGGAIDIPALLGILGLAAVTAHRRRKAL
jgi:serine protease